MKVIFSRILLIFAILILATNCKSSGTEDEDVPACIEIKIDEIISNEVSNPPTQVWKWEVDDKTYYYITSDCCDQYNILYSENCDIVCAPDGGFTGNGDGNCPDFKGEIVQTLVWEDNRN
mgnify:CR=1 FL=1|tara:strand:+ start:5693 stop:6052 length:360 start_codon:yes stop_codon:yes gene_type:complete